MKTILVTGGCGFIGSCFILQEIAAGNKVINVDKLTYAADPANLKDVINSPEYKFIKGDICDKDIIHAVLEGFEVDWVVNFAAESHVDNSIEKPAEFITTNVMGVYNLLQNSLNYWKELEGIRKKNFRFVQISTDEVFGSLGETGKFTENTPYDPSSPYSSSKAGGDMLAKAWHKTYGLPVIITNCTNNYGPRQHREKLIPKIISCCLNEKEIPVYGDGKNVRDWIFVEDHCRGIKLALENGNDGEAYGFGGNCEKNNNEIVEIICSAMDNIMPRKNNKKYSELVTYVTDRPGHDKRYAFDDSKARNTLGYSSTNSFNDAIERTIEYYLNK